MTTEESVNEAINLQIYACEQSKDTDIQNDLVRNESTLKVKMENAVEESGQIDYTKDILLGIDDNPPWHLLILMGLQHYFTFLGSVVSLPFLIAPHLCMDVSDPARAHLTYTMLFIFGIGTLMQTIFGTRLPIIQGGSFAYLVPAFTILSLPQFKCPENWMETHSNETLWHSRMRELQGDVALASILQILLGATGAIGFLLRWITPLVIAPTITLIGLSLFAKAADLAAKCWPISIGSILFMILFSQYLSKIKIPIPFFDKRLKRFSTIGYPIFSVLPILFSIMIMWTICYILTITDTLPLDSTARTDRGSEIINASPWVKFPIPMEFGWPTVSTAGVIGMAAAVIASVVESVGDYYACARICQISAPPVHVINRGIAVEGLAGIIAGLWGAGVGATSLSQNIGAIGLTKVASRRVVQTAAVLMLIFGIFTKFGSVFVTIPEPIVGGIYCVMFGLITAVGISNVQFINLNSSRNMLILGFSIFAGMAVPSWVSKQTNLHFTGIETLDQVFFVILSTNMLLGGLLGFILDNTIPGSDEERGLLEWRALHKKSANDSTTTYDLPFQVNIFPTFITKYIPFMK